MTQPAGYQITCERVDGSTVRNCGPVSAAFRRSFRGATVQDVSIKGDRAAARFSNGEAVELALVHEAAGAMSEVGGVGGSQAR